MYSRSAKSSYRDRTQEFLTATERLKKTIPSHQPNAQFGNSAVNAAEGPKSSAVSVHSEFNKRASKIGLGIHFTAYCCTSQVQYSDLVEVDRASILEKFRQSTSEWSQNINVLPGDCTESGNGDHKCTMIVVTDACLLSVVPREAPVSAHILINYELPTKKVYGNLYSDMDDMSLSCVAREEMLQQGNEYE
ncbi:uncharacterized protein A4U43_C06F10970 [Asparagus officinalis]|uniref:Syntaxin-5 N-terminal Sly1p-binding domain-containing protein n=1 Tax=Asparagus officinalis TaxID=4686 RepID=A0A5P1EQ62_ASPOF|nr:uncharacterized protein A4U43_C06F10970 [Asparagus officinalis]